MVHAGEESWLMPHKTLWWAERPTTYDAGSDMSDSTLLWSTESQEAQLTASLQAERDRQEFEAKMRKWETHFAAHEEELKDSYFDWYITLDYENGNYTIGPSRAASKAAFEEKYGVRDCAYTGHIGSA
jgi:hypothetical protein